jgi:hypothetical protein
MTTRRAAAKADAEVMIDIDARLAPFFSPPPVGVIDLLVDSSPQSVEPAHRRRTQLRHEPV